MHATSTAYQRPEGCSHAARYADADADADTVAASAFSPALIPQTEEIAESRPLGETEALSF